MLKLEEIKLALIIQKNEKTSSHNIKRLEVTQPRDRLGIF